MTFSVRKIISPLLIVFVVFFMVFAFLFYSLWGTFGDFGLWITLLPFALLPLFEKILSAAWRDRIFCGLLILDNIYLLFWIYVFSVMNWFI